ncbi:hypothetical protein D6855_12275 [Butyrivibrio sp. CB08]|uniref:hypothetical protein n=1 Tax=Butyrivibrio sp. CB08 TaxID=2364879 RepID=UPI000EAA7C70|nr:hypothetical protein [Butyrivibrio sp. CB08]RKM57819.1 hypothetical protein D6855_12275 [Butyrivibrio sp. CB08]
MIKKRLKLPVIIVISLIVWILSINFGGLYYEDNDDIAMNMIAAGAYGDPGSQYFLCSGIIIGHLVKALYSVFGNVNCYLWTDLVISLISVISIAVVLSDEFDLLGSAVITFLVSVFFARDFYISIQFSKNAAMYAGAGFLLMLSFIYRGGKDFVRLFVASFLFLISYSVRKEGFFFLLPFALVALAVVLIPVIKSENRSKILLPLLIPLFGVLLSLGANYYTYALDPEWKEYYVRDRIYTDKRDFGNYNFEWNKEEYLEAGFTEWDFKLLDMWYYNDVDNFSVDKIKLLKEIGESTRIDRIRLESGIVKDTFVVIRDAFKEGPLAAVTVIVIVLSAIYCIRRKKYIELLGILVLSGGIFMECYYLANIRRPLWRVEYGSWLAGLLMVLGSAVMPDMKMIIEHLKSSGSASDKNEKPIWKALCVCASVATVVVVFIWQAKTLDYSYDNYAYSDTDRYELFQAISKADGFFVVSPDDMFGGLNGARNIMEIDRRYAGLYSNVTAAGGYVVPAPNGMYYAHQHGITNAFGSLADRDDMYYVGGGERMGYLLMYINEKYGPGIDVKEVAFDGFTAWKYFRSGE